MRFLEIIGGWINRYFSHEEAIYLVLMLVVGFLVLFLLGGVLAPILTGLVLAFLLQGVVRRLINSTSLLLRPLGRSGCESMW